MRRRKRSRRRRAKSNPNINTAFIGIVPGAIIGLLAFATFADEKSFGGRGMAGFAFGGAVLGAGAGYMLGK